jgi:signal transduction histidine kinase
VGAGGGEGFAWVRVVDQGAGIPEEFRSIAFERFTRSDTWRGRTEGGAGLGLAIVAELTRLNGGTVAIEEGSGGRVRASFPVSPQHP